MAKKWLVLNESIYAAHSIPKTGRCSNKHGHTYKVSVILAPKETGTLRLCKSADTMIMEAASIRAVLLPVFDKYDHCDLNDILHESTVEELANALYRDITVAGFDILRLTIMETDTFGVLME